MAIERKVDEPLGETWSLRRQLIVPLAVTILVIAAAVSAIAWWAARDSERRWAADKMDTVYGQLSQASYPLTESVIEQIRNYSGVDAVIVPRRGAPLATLSEAEARGLVQRASTPREMEGKLSLGERRYHYRRYSAAAGFRDGQSQELFLLVQQPTNPGFLYAPVWAPIASGLVSALAMILVTTMVGSRIVRRIGNLESQVVRIAHGNFDVVEPAGPHDAIRRLSVSINSMSSQLGKAQDWIARTERARLISMIAGGMAHQLRNALTGASLLVQSHVKSHPGEPPEELVMAENQLKLAAESVRRLLASDPSVEMVDEPTMSAHAITDAVKDCVASYAEHQEVTMTWDREGLDRDVDVPHGSAVVGAMINLAMNAIEAAGRGGQVRCELGTLERSGSSSPQVRWRVIDNGPGPDPRLADTMMEPFVTSKKEGVGLGLAMAARVASRCRGSLTWRREAPETIFELILPIADGDRAP